MIYGAGIALAWGAAGATTLIKAGSTNWQPSSSTQYILIGAAIIAYIIAGATLCNLATTTLG